MWRVCQEVFGALVERGSSIEQAGQSVRRNRLTLCGCSSVPVRVPVTVTSR